jgi:hypothetical protein
VAKRRRRRDFHAELIRLAWLALADAFDLRRMQAEHPQIGACRRASDRPQLLVLGMNAPRQRERRGEQRV